MKIKAAVMRELNCPLNIEGLTLDEPKSNEVLIKIVATGICHSDAAALDGSLPTPLPTILGHEGAGIVEKVGDNVKNVQAGDHVVIAMTTCGNCDSCRHGHPTTCDKNMTLNFTGVAKDGTTRIHKDEEDIGLFFGQSSFSTYVVTDESAVVKVEKDVDLRFLGPLGCGISTGSGAVLNNLDPEAGSSFVVFGTGGVGLSALMAAKIAECKEIIAVDIHESRLEFAKELGATHVINSKTESIIDRLNEITGNKGVNYALDTTGVPVVIESGISALSTRGKIALVASSPNEISFVPSAEIISTGKTIVGSAAGDSVPQTFIPKLVDFYKDGKLPIDKLTKFYELEDINQAFEDSANGSVVKPILVIDESYTI